MPFAEPTPGPLPLSGRGHPVSSVEIIGQPVTDAGLGMVGALHLAEMIRYRDGTKPDVVGYDPEGRGFAHGSDRLFAETSLGEATAEQYIAAGSKQYRLQIEALPQQTLEQFVARQEHAWKMYDRSQGVERYDGIGNDATYHNSHGSMVASIRDAGRPDVADRLQRDLEPPERMRALEHGPDHLSPEAAGVRVALERRLVGEPSAPGASNEPRPAQIEGRATPEPEDQGGLPGRQGLGTVEALDSFVFDPPNRSERKPDMLDGAPQRDGSFFTLMRTSAQGFSSLQRVREPFQQSGAILTADAERVVQSIGRGQTFTYKTEDLLQAAQDRNGALQQLERAAVNHETARIALDSRGLDVSTRNMDRGYEHGR